MEQAVSIAAKEIRELLLAVASPELVVAWHALPRQAGSGRGMIQTIKTLAPSGLAPNNTIIIFVLPGTF